MRVGLLIGTPPPQLGGGYTYQDDLFQCFLETASESRHGFHVVCEPGYAAEVHRRIAGRTNVTVAPMARHVLPSRGRAMMGAARRALGKRPEAGSRVARVAKERGLQLLWSLGHYEHQAFDVPYITPVLDLQHRLQPWFPEVSHDRQWDLREDYFRNYLRRATYVITGTEEGRREIEHFYGVSQDRIRVVPLGTPQFAIEGANLDVSGRLEALGLKPGFLFYPAQFWAHKNHANLLEALRILRDENQLTCELVLVGSDRGNEAHVRKLVADLKLERQVRILGFVSQDDLIAIYRAASMLTYLTFFGPDNLPPLEACALGCPVVASDVPGAKEQLGDAALFVVHTNPRDIAMAIKRVHEDESVKESLRAAGRRRAASWTGQDYVRSVLGIIEEFDAIRRCWA